MPEPVVEAPVLETDRLVLRPMVPADLDALAGLWADPVVTRFIGGAPLTREQVWSRLLRHLGIWQTMGFGFWAVTLRDGGLLVGEAGFHELRREIVPSLEGTMETGWCFVPSVHGRGLATEAVAAMLAWGDARHPFRRKTCMIEPANTESIRVARRHGFEEFARATYNGAPMILFERRA